ncbi:alpha/beta hydrolase [Actinomadura macrotermitis]|uniref:DUF676 domain-containing protein n=1 Tax=Actinomadura macrotermitis TaxID=2585200 RepID=A0A7K0BNN8_9ACTN|nr:hypothetical protein [Actinomadura macrotermitis]MQY02482.1 hypothetical protein [Actinomadura macrotermitis]
MRVPGRFVAVSALTAAVAAVPALHAVPAAAAGSADPVYLVHGVQWDGGADCASAWRQATPELRGQGLRGPVVMWGYYKGDRNCTRKYDGGRDTSVKELGRRLAWDIYLRHSRQGRYVNVLAHSMGGLVTAAALAGVRKYGGRSAAWPPYLRVRNAVTLSTPFRGTTCSARYRQCTDLRAGSALLRWLAASPNPQGRGGTDWTLIGAHDDTRVKTSSALGMKARHKDVYAAGQHITHVNLHHLAGPGNWKLAWSADYGKHVHRTAKGKSPLRLAAMALATTSW